MHAIDTVRGYSRVRFLVSLGVKKQSGPQIRVLTGYLFDLKIAVLADVDNEF